MQKSLARHLEDAIYLYNQIVKDQFSQLFAAKQLPPKPTSPSTTLSGDFRMICISLKHKPLYRLAGRLNLVVFVICVNGLLIFAPSFLKAFVSKHPLTDNFRQGE